jgi:hypothetical protein
MGYFGKKFNAFFFLEGGKFKKKIFFYGEDGEVVFCTSNKKK